LSWESVRGLGEGLKVGGQRWDEFGPKRNAKGNHCSENSRLEEGRPVFVLIFCCPMNVMKFVCDGMILVVFICFFSLVMGYVTLLRVG